MARRIDDFHTIRSEGGLLPPDLLKRVLDPKEKLDGTHSEDYGLPQGERLNEVITQSWNRLRKHWGEFRASAEKLPKDEPGTGLTNDKWSLPLLRELGFGLLPTSAGPDFNGRIYAINRFFGPVPIHLVGCGLSLDRRAAGVRGAAAANPHGLVQDFLNRSPGHLWAILSNGLRLRVLRDSQALSRQSFLEFDLQAMFDGEAYSDFVLLWLMAHATRFAPREGERPETCWLEQWTKEAEKQGTRALGDLREGVERALQIFGEGFTSHPNNAALRDTLRTGQLKPTDFHGQLLRVVYRLIFLFVSEDRPLEGRPVLHPRDDSGKAQVARERYAEHYSTRRLRELASTIKGSRHGDLWRQFQLVVGALSSDPAFASAREHLALPVLGSFLWDPDSTAGLKDAELTNHDLLEALRHLAFTRQGKALRPVDYKNIGADELGGVYESLLALTPQISSDGSKFTFAEFAGNERKTSGSYYTPDSLVQCLLDSALDPIVEEAIKGKNGTEAERAILALKICDPAVGSGHFLVGAAHRLARHLARVRALAQGESEPSPLLYQHALRNVIGRCLYGVDINPMAAELCRVSLWLEALEPGKPLSFLDHHIRVGNSLLGATPELIAAGLPDEAFTAIEGDDKKACAVLKKRNKADRAGLGSLFAQQDAEIQAHLQQASSALEELPDDRPEDIRAKEQAFRRHEQTEEYRRKKQLADTWCAAFVILKQFRDPGRESSVSGITQVHLNEMAVGQPLPDELGTEVQSLSSLYQFFHWHLAFPEVFAKSGFDCVLGNPPWERLQLEEKQFFAGLDPTISDSGARDRKRLIENLAKTDSHTYSLYCEAIRKSAAEAHLIRSGKLLPLAGTGNLSAQALFVELTAKIGKAAGLIVPRGLATQDNQSALYKQLIESGRLHELLDFENRRGLFAGTHRQFWFCLVVLGVPRLAARTRFAFFLETVEELHDEARTFELDLAKLRVLSPNSLSPPTLKRGDEVRLLEQIYAHSEVLKPAETNGSWGWHSWQMFNETHEAAELRRHEDAVGTDKLVRLYEAKLIHQFDHRFASYVDGQPASCTDSEKTSADFTVQTRYFVSSSIWDDRVAPRNESRQWILAFRLITNASNERTMIASVLPRCAGTVSIPFVVSNQEPRLQALLLANLNSYVLDYVCRLRVSGTSLNHFILHQLPVLPPMNYTELCSWDKRLTSWPDWLLPRVLELTYTSWELEAFAKDCGCSSPPFRWDEERRFLLRCELDAAFFHLYLPADKSGDWRPAEGETAEYLLRLKVNFLTPRDAVAYIMDTFPIVRRKDEGKYDGDYRTKRIILEIYDGVVDSIRTGQPYQTRLNPPPADPRCCHLARE